jgi:hypothetical protein
VRYMAQLPCVLGRETASCAARSSPCSRIIKYVSDSSNIETPRKIFGATFRLTRSPVRSTHHQPAALGSPRTSGATASAAENKTVTRNDFIETFPGRMLRKQNPEPLLGEVMIVGQNLDNRQ